MDLPVTFVMGVTGPITVLKTEKTGRRISHASIVGWWAIELEIAQIPVIIGRKISVLTEILIQTKCQNPIIFFDELDKVSDTPKGEEIIGILTHLIDATQNNQFHDKYF